MREGPGLRDPGLSQPRQPGLSVSSPWGKGAVSTALWNPHAVPTWILPLNPPSSTAPNVPAQHPHSPNRNYSSSPFLN